MYGEIITIGDELTSGRTLNLNGWYAAGRLTAAGLKVTRITSVGDNYPMVAEALERALENSRFIIVTGGLGSTQDDKTSEIVAKALNRPLSLDQKMFRLLEEYAKARGLTITSSLEKMAWMPNGSRLLSPEGRACGFCLVEKGVRLYFLPGVPEQMRYLMDKVVIPELLSFYDEIPVTRSRILKLYGLTEPHIAEMFRELEDRTGDVVLGFYPQFPEIHITLSLRGEDEATVSGELDRVEAEIRQVMGTYIFAQGNESMEEVVGRLLVDRKLTLSLAESCTGGLIGHRITNVSGSSEYFQGGIVCYSNRAKIQLLGV
ncbi:MAG: competence protein, partial [Deltaproteobacteria bacterium]